MTGLSRVAHALAATKFEDTTSLSLNLIISTDSTLFWPSGTTSAGPNVVGTKSFLYDRLTVR